MNTRQATQRLASLGLLLVLVSACASPATPLPLTATPRPPTRTPTPQATPTIKILPTNTAPACLSQPGRVEEGSLASSKPAQKFRIYLPPCYDEETDRRYPVLYLLHGQTFNYDQWIRLGAVRTLDRLILSGDAEPFIIVFPDDRYWNLQAGSGFGDRLVNAVIPYVDSTYRTLADRKHRAIGGMSRGAGWSLRLGLTHWDLFAAIGLHSLAVMQSDASRIRDWVAKIPPASRPEIFMDIGDNDQELLMAERVESLFNDFGISHEWHLYSGAHSETYWSAHVEEYIRWYAEELDK